MSSLTVGCRLAPSLVESSLRYACFFYPLAATWMVSGFELRSLLVVVSSSSIQLVVAIYHGI